MTGQWNLTKWTYKIKKLSTFIKFNFFLIHKQILIILYNLYPLGWILTDLSHNYCIPGNFWINKFLKNVICQMIQNNIFKEQSRDLASSHYNSVILKLYVQKLLVTFEIFINKTILKLCIIYYMALYTFL